VASPRAKRQSKEKSMRKLVGVFAAIGVLGAATFAFAAGPAVTATGKVKSVDMMRHTITLEDGSTHKFARGVSIDRVKVGDKVTLTYSSVGTISEVSEIAPAAD
jgi:Cu/Ag efflux protein CusF